MADIEVVGLLLWENGSGERIHHRFADAIRHGVKDHAEIQAVVARVFAHGVKHRRSGERDPSRQCVKEESDHEKWLIADAIDERTHAQNHQSKSPETSAG